MGDQPIFVDIPGGWATVLVALISFVVGPIILQGRANRRLKKIDEKTDRTLDQVENNHVDADGNPINMREENDDRHEEIIGILRDHGEILERHDKSLAALSRSDGVQDERLQRIEDTWPRSRFMPPPKHRAPETNPNGDTNE